MKLSDVPMFMATFTHIAPLHCFQIITFHVRHFAMVCWVFIQLITIWIFYPYSLLQHNYFFLLLADHVLKSTCILGN